MIPEFSERGYLPKGNHKSKASEFINYFTHDAGRRHFAAALLGVIEYAKATHASSILFGGSFVTNRPQPNDVDCVILYSRAGLIPTVPPALAHGGVIVDLYFASADNPDIVSSFRKLFSTAKNGDDIGTIEVEVGNTLSFDNFPEPDPELLTFATHFYGQRHSIHTSQSKKVLVPVHGLMSHAEWYADVSLLGSLNGWTVAPFLYGFQDPSIFLKRTKRLETVDMFRDHLTDICQLCDTNSVSVIAHSFGTYIALSYILGFDDPPTRFDTIILTGAIVDEELDLGRLNGKIGHMLNEIAPNDEWVDWAKRANLAQDELFGSAGTVGFRESAERLVQHRSDVFSHNNVIKRDVIKSRWIPTLQANFGSVDRDRRALNLK